MSFKNYLGLAFAFLLLTSNVANADTIIFEFKGTVTYGGYMASPGNKVAGIFAYDTNVPAIAISDNQASYQMPQKFGIAIKVGKHVAAANNLNIGIVNNFGGNVEDVVDITGSSTVVDGTSFPNGALGFQLASGPGNTGVLKNTKLPQSFNVSKYNAGPTLNYGFLQMDGSANGQLLQFTIDSITVLEKLH